jgi:Tfp pilus assembly protein PilO
MSSVLADHAVPGAITNGGRLRGRAALHTWGVRRRLAVFVTTAVLTASLAGVACTIGDFAGLHASEGRLDEVQRELEQAQRTVARLPVLRAAAAPQQVQRAHPDTTAEDIRSISGLASRSGLSLQSLEPAAAGGTGAATFRTLKLVARGGFAQLHAFLAGLAEAPGLTVPVDIAIRRAEGTALSITATLQVFDRLPALPLPGVVSAHDDPPFDPFTDRFAARMSDGMRLAGIMQDGAAIVALIETPEGTEAVRSGQPFGSARVERVAPSHVVLSSGGVDQTLNWAEDAK